MISTILQFKNYIIVGALAFAIGSGIGSVTSYNLTANYKDAQQVSALSKQRDSYETSIAIANDQNRKINSYQGDTIIELMADKENILKERNENVTSLNARIEKLRRPNADGTRVVFHDPHAKPVTCPAGVQAVPGETSTNAADTGRLSEETTENLLDYARDAEITRLDLIAQIQFSDKLTERYNELLRRIDEIKRSSSPSSRP